MMQRESKLMGLQRPSAQFQVNHEGRKPLFAAKDQDASRMSLADDGIRAGATGHKDASRRRSANDFGFRASRDGSASLLASPGGSRIPQPSSLGGLAKRRPISLAEAFKLAQGEEDFGDDSDGGVDGPVDGSPSPAPRPWRMRTDSDVNKMRKLLSKDHLDSKGQSKGGQPVANMSSSGTLVMNSKETVPASVPSIISPTGRSTDVRGVTVSSPRLSQQLSSRGSLPGSTVGLPELVPGIDDAPSLSVERPTRIPSPIYQPSPEKSFAWQVDEDFDAGELQISDSPRLRVGRHLFENRLSYDDNGKVSLNSGLKPPNADSQNTKLDDIRSREIRTGSNIPLDRPTPRTYISKLDLIRARESQVEQQIPIPNRHLERLRNTKLDEIRQREENGLTRRAHAAARLQEIKEMNQMTRFNKPEEVARPPSARGLYERYNKDPAVPETNGSIPTAAAVATSTARPRTAAGEATGRMIPDTPVTIFKRDPRHSHDGDGKFAESTDTGDREDAQPQQVVAAHKEKEATAKSEQPRSEGRVTEDDIEWVRRLARAASTSPAVAEAKPEPQLEDLKLPLPVPLPLPLPAGNGSRSRSASGTHATALVREMDAREPEPAALTLHRVQDSKENLIKPTIQEVTEKPRSTASSPAALLIKPPAPLHRAQLSVSSVKSKRSSMQSETDPTDRIEAEMKLFAPADNQSERGSLRAPSPAPDADDDDDDEDNKEYEDNTTPRPIKPDPLSMPTPRVIGAFVDTPIVSKMEKKFVDEPVVPFQTRARARTEPVPRPSTSTSILRERRASLAWRTKSKDTLSDPGTADDSDVDVGVTTSAAVKRPRAKSLPRRRPPVKNSAKPPSVKDDLLLLQRAYNVDDSTFDDLDEILSGRKPLTLRSNGLSDSSKELSFRSSEEDSDFDFQVIPTAAVSAAPAATAAAPTKSPRKEKKTDPEAPSRDLATLDRMNKTLQTGIWGIRTAKQGIERLEGQIAQVNMPALESKAMETATSSDVKQAAVLKQEENKTRPVSEKDRSGCAASPKSTYLTDIHLAIPRLFYRKPQFRLTLLGLLVFILSIWYAAESAMCSMYCRPATCSASRAPCAWSYDDPWTFGTALPIKVDQWVTGGHGRAVFNHFMEEAYDWVGDMQDLALGREITEINIEKLSYEEKRRHRRRLRKRGLAKQPPQPNAETQAKWDAWHQTRMAKERAREAKEMGYAVRDGSDGWLP